MTKQLIPIEVIHLLSSWSKPASTSPPPPTQFPRPLEQFELSLPNWPPLHKKEAEMILFSIEFTLRIFFTAFHSLVLASFCSSKNPDWIQWAMSVCNQNTHSLCVRHSKVEIEKRDCRQANTCKGIHILYIFTWPIFPFPFLSNVYHCTGWQKQFGTVFCCVSFTVQWDKAHVLSLLSCCIRGFHYMSVYLAKA